MIKPFKTFISYSWDNEKHKSWVRDLAAKLRSGGIDVTLDRWALEPGDLLPKFMETSIREHERILIVCTPNYKQKADGRQGGVGYEGDIMTGEVFSGKDPRKFIPVLRSGSWVDSIPTWMSGKVGVDLRGHSHQGLAYEDLLNTLRGTREQAPPIGIWPPISDGDRPGTPSPSSESKLACSTAEVARGPIRITGLIANEVGTPRGDGTRGSGLYSVPFLLSRRPSTAWAMHFVRTWDRPPTWSTMHRPGIASVRDDRIILDGTTVEEVSSVHRRTLQAVVDKVNRDVDQWELEQKTVAEFEAQRHREHRRSVEEAAKLVDFSESESSE